MSVEKYVPYQYGECEYCDSEGMMYVQDDGIRIWGSGICIDCIYKLDKLKNTITQIDGGIINGK